MPRVNEARISRNDLPANLLRFNPAPAWWFAIAAAQASSIVAMAAYFNGRPRSPLLETPLFHLPQSFPTREAALAHSLRSPAKLSSADIFPSGFSRQLQLNYRGTDPPPWRPSLAD